MVLPVSFNRRPGPSPWEIQLANSKQPSLARLRARCQIVLCRINGSGGSEPISSSPPQLLGTEVICNSTAFRHENKFDALEGHRKGRAESRASLRL